eukprot:3260647-Rhodomonas_salina.1
MVLWKSSMFWLTVRSEVKEIRRASFVRACYRKRKDTLTCASISRMSSSASAKRSPLAATDSLKPQNTNRHHESRCVLPANAVLRIVGEENPHCRTALALRSSLSIDSDR